MSECELHWKVPDQNFSLYLAFSQSFISNSTGEKIFMCFTVGGVLMKEHIQTYSITVPGCFQDLSLPNGKNTQTKCHYR